MSAIYFGYLRLVLMGSDYSAHHYHNVWAGSRKVSPAL